MKNFKTKDLLVSIRPGVAGNEFGKQISALHLQTGGKCTQPSKTTQVEQATKCTQPSKAILFKPVAIKEGPTRTRHTAPLGATTAEPCPCPSKPVLTEAQHVLTPDNIAALVELKKTLSTMQAKTECLL